MTTTTQDKFTAMMRSGRKTTGQLKRKEGIPMESDSSKRSTLERVWQYENQVRKAAQQILQVAVEQHLTLAQFEEAVQAVKRIALLSTAPID